MLVLAFFALLAGAGTAISPCVLPVLPALLSAAGSGGRRRPLGVVTGLTVTFTVTIVGLSKVVDGVGLGSSFTRDIAIAALLVFGAAVLVPRIGDRLEAPLSRLARFGPSSVDGDDGFVGGLGVGAALGFVYAPCAGPILGAVIAVSAATGKTFVVGLAYAVGSAAVLFALALGGRGLLDRVRRGGRGPQVQQALGAIMVLTAIAMTFSLDTRFQTAIADHLPSAVVNPTKGLEDSSAVKKRLADLRGTSRFVEAQKRADAQSTTTTAPPAPPAQAAAASGPGLPGVRTPKLAKLGPAPDFKGTQQWFNTADGRPLTMAQLRGKVVLIDFWTYTCINCIRTLPYIRAWDAKYRSKGLVIVGVHSPEFGFEKKASNVKAAIAQNKLRYPVVQDNDMNTWNAWQNQYWPADYLVDKTGQVRHAHFGEGDYKQTEAAIRALLAEGGAKDLGTGATATGTISLSKAKLTPETYFGTSHRGTFTTEPRAGTHAYTAEAGSALPEDTFSLGGTWKIRSQSATAVKDSTIDVHFTAQHVYLVLSSQGDVRRSVGVTVDGSPRPAVPITTQKLYTIVDLPAAGTHELHLQLPPKVSGFAFTFG